MMTGHILARLILEADDEPLDIEAEVKRLTGTPHPGIEIEIEGNHWNVDRRSETRGKVRQGQIYRNELEDMPREAMSPEAIAQWEAVGWIAIPLSPHIDTKFTKTFDEAVTFLASLRFVGENEDDEQDEPTIDPETEIKRYFKPIQIRVTNPADYGKAAGKTFVAVVTWPDENDMKYQSGYKRLQPLITFYDAAYPDEENPEGQRISRYNASSIASMDGRNGLDLYGSEPAWKIAPEPLRLILNWLHQELEVKQRLKLKPGFFDSQYESQDDPDNPELYTNPERVAGTPKHVLLETAFRAMLKPYYDQIDIQKKETNYFSALSEYIHWRIICKRTTGPLRLPNMPTTEWWKPVSKTNAIEWRKQVEKWFMEAAHRHGLVLRNFNIYGRLRRDPYFTFETYKWKTSGVAEGLEDDPESVFKDIVSKIDWDKDLEQALRQFHPYGVGYSVVMSNHRQAVITVWTYFPVERRDVFAEEVKNFVVKWLTDTHVMPVNDVQMTKWEQSRGYDYNGFVVYINCPQVADAMRTDARRTSML